MRDLFCIRCPFFLLLCVKLSGAKPSKSMVVLGVMTFLFNLLHLGVLIVDMTQAG